jgi:uncharacterized membrane protein YphA (DoxX/SURF4 family)
MAIDRHAAGLTVLRICVGAFLFFEGLAKLRWFADSSILGAQLSSWLETSGPASVSRWYLEHVALPGLPYFARLVPLGEIGCGMAMLVGFCTPAVAFVAFLMVLSFHVASGAIAKFGFLTNGYGLPVLGATLALAVGGVRLPWSFRR